MEGQNKKLQNMRSKIRLLTIVFSLIMLTAFSSVPYIVFIKNGLFELTFVSVIAVIMIALVFGGLFAIYRFTLIVDLDSDKSQVVFYYPFRFKRSSFNFNEILGFRFKYLSGKIEYKALQIRTKSGYNFSFSDFETSNLRDFEDKFLIHFDLRQGKSFDELNKLEKEQEILNSKAFDIQQAKEIRFYFFLIIGFCIFLLAVIINKNVDSGIEFSNLSIVGILTILIILIFSVRKLKDIMKIIKNGA